MNTITKLFKKKNPYPVRLFAVMDRGDDIERTGAFITKLGIDFVIKEGDSYFEAEFFVKSKMDSDWILEELKREIDEVKRP